MVSARLPRRWLNHAAAQTYWELPDDDIRARVSAVLDHVCANPLYGKPLAARAHGDLSDCDVAYVVDVPTDTGRSRPDYRVVYRLRPGRSAAELVEVICVDERRGLAAYYRALGLLGR